jgi:hypothetical protein
LHVEAVIVRAGRLVTLHEVARGRARCLELADLHAGAARVRDRVPEELVVAALHVDAVVVGRVDLVLLDPVEGVPHVDALVAVLDQLVLLDDVSVAFDVDPRVARVLDLVLGDRDPARGRHDHDPALLDLDDRVLLDHVTGPFELDGIVADEREEVLLDARVDRGGEAVAGEIRGVVVDALEAVLLDDHVRARIGAQPVHEGVLKRAPPYRDVLRGGDVDDAIAGVMPSALRIVTIGSTPPPPSMTGLPLPLSVRPVLPSTTKGACVPFATTMTSPAIAKSTAAWIVAWSSGTLSFAALAMAGASATRTTAAIRTRNDG